MACWLSMGTIVCYRGNNLNTPSASLSLLTGSRTRISVSLNLKKPMAPISSGILLSTAFTSSLLSLSSASSFSGSSRFGMDLISSIGNGTKRRGSGGLVVRAVKYSLGQTKRNRSRKSLARTHGFRKRMSTTRGRAVLKRRRAKGRWILCTKSNPSSGKRV